MGRHMDFASVDRQTPTKAKLFCLASSNREGYLSIAASFAFPEPPGAGREPKGRRLLSARGDFFQKRRDC